MVTYEDTITASEFYIDGEKYADGKNTKRCRRNGATKTWKTRPGHFRIPVKYGLKTCFYITHANAHHYTPVRNHVIVEEI
jgi:hypothetical protein